MTLTNITITQIYLYQRSAKNTQFIQIMNPILQWFISFPDAVIYVSNMQETNSRARWHALDNKKPGLFFIELSI